MTYKTTLQSYEAGSIKIDFIYNRRMGRYGVFVNGTCDCATKDRIVASEHFDRWTEFTARIVAEGEEL